MVKPEFTGERDLSYSRWHRTIGDPFYEMDLDSVEWRGNRGVVAFIETAIFDLHNSLRICDALDRKEWEIKVLSELQQKTRLPAYLVLHTPDLNTFWIFKITAEAKTIFHKCLGKEQYIEFIRSL